MVSGYAALRRLCRAAVVPCSWAMSSLPNVSRLRPVMASDAYRSKPSPGRLRHHCKTLPSLQGINGRLDSRVVLLGCKALYRPLRVAALIAWHQAWEGTVSGPVRRVFIDSVANGLIVRQVATQSDAGQHQNAPVVHPFSTVVGGGGAVHSATNE